MIITDAKLSEDGKTIHCWYDDGRQCSFPYPLTDKVNNGRLGNYAAAAQSWLDDGNIPATLIVVTPPEAELEDTDKKMARITEDLIDVLVGKGVIDLIDLPRPAQGTISERKTLRSKL
jgi:hypothetical protein